jgi:8-oxo-dGTP pyrophosphatase MutT (NUDIX family)
LRLPTNWQFVKWNERKLRNFLRRNGIPYHAWQYSPHANTFDQLLASLEVGEVWIEERTDDCPVLHIQVAVTSIRHEHRRGINLFLREFRKQSSGKLRERRFSGSVGGKIAFSRETAEQAARREIREELRLTQADMFYVELKPEYIEITDAHASEFHPGFVDVYHRHHFSCEFPPILYRTHYSHTATNNRLVEHHWVPENIVQAV